MGNDTLVKAHSFKKCKKFKIQKGVHVGVAASNSKDEEEIFCIFSSFLIPWCWWNTGIPGRTDDLSERFRRYRHPPSQRTSVDSGRRLHRPLLHRVRQGQQPSGLRPYRLN
eukprot:GHVL01010719.1.p1 GENE.GHVL01010719.1~~GHVL01010719.1.p1  ORF type:complete len:111 (+),score=16.20 GHVL01010719.1:44-376(+)